MIRSLVTYLSAYNAFPLILLELIEIAIQESAEIPLMAKINIFLTGENQLACPNTFANSEW